MSIEVNANRLDRVSSMTIDRGGHEDMDEGMCIMEAVSYVAGEEWSDTPSCACPVIGAFMRAWNDALPDDRRNELLKPMVLRLVGTKTSAEIEERRSLMAAGWLVRVHTPAWLRLAGLTEQAFALTNLPEITAMAHVPGIRPVIEAVRKDASAAWDAAWDAAGDAAGAAAGDAAGDAAKQKLAPTVAELQVSAIGLIDRMIAVQA